MRLRWHSDLDVLASADGERALKKLLQHKSEDVQQFAAGALANLQLYRRAKDEVCA